MSSGLGFLGRRLPIGGRESHQAVNDSLVDCCRHLSGLVTDRPTKDGEAPAAGAPAGDRPAARAELLVVRAEFERLQTDERAWPAIVDGSRPWPDVAPRLLDLLLTAAAAALDTDPSLTALIADTVLQVRAGSRAAWRLRAQAHEHWGDLPTAIGAHEQYLRRTPDDRLGVRERIERLRSLQAARIELAGVIDDALIAADEQGERVPAGTDRLRDLLARPAGARELDPALEDLRADLIGRPVAELAGPVGLADVLRAVSACLRTSQLEPPPLPASLVASLVVLRLGDLRSWLEGRSLCLVVAGDHETDLDAYDLVARFAGRRDAEAASGPGGDHDAPAAADAGRTDPAEPHPGRTDLMILRHDQRHGWGRPADLRLVLADEPREWEEAVRHHLVPGAQRGLLDKALRRPVAMSALRGDDRAPRRATNAFQIVRLLDHLDVNPVIDLIGFDRPGLLSADERDWLRPLVRRSGHDRISLR